MARLMLGVLVAVACALGGDVAFAAEAPRWDIDYSKSSIEFTAEQAGADFTGRFDKFEAEVRFAADALASSSARVTVPAESVNTENDERDGYLRGLGWFEAEKFPEVTFETTSFEALPDGRLRAHGKLEVRELIVEVPFEFTVKRAGADVTLDGTTKLDRFVLGLGLGEWADTQWIGKDVTVKVHVVAKVP